MFFKMGLSVKKEAEARGLLCLFSRSTWPTFQILDKGTGCIARHIKTNQPNK